jgi:hypothetical protein
VSLLAVALLAVALLVAVVGAASATEEGEAPMTVSADQSGSLGVVSTAQSDTETDPESGTERRLVGRESSERVDAVVIALWSIAAGMAVMLVLFLWHTSPRRRLRLARRRSVELYDGEADLAEGAADSESADDAEDAVEDPDAEDAMEDPEVAGSELPPVWDDDAEPAAADPETAAADAEPAAADPETAAADAEPAAADPETAVDSLKIESGAAEEGAGEPRLGFWMQLRRFWMQLRRTLGLD